jgi:mycothiol synthase
MAPDPPPDPPVRLRPLEDSDIPAVVALISAADAVDCADEGASEEEFRAWVAQPTDAGNHFVALAPSGEIIGYGDVHHQAGDDGAWGWIVTHPAWRGRGVGSQIADCVREQAQRLGVLWIDYGVDMRLAQATAWMRRLGFEPVRTYTRWNRDAAAPAPPVVPPRFTIRPFAPGLDDPTALDIFNISFADHRNANVVAAEAIAEGGARLDFDPQGLFVAESAEGGIAGVCWCHINRAENARRGARIGWINDLGVAPAYRRQGLGRALLYTGISWLREQDMESIALWMDRANRVARALYEDAGFSVDKSVTDYRHFLVGPRAPTPGA